MATFFVPGSWRPGRRRWLRTTDGGSHGCPEATARTLQGPPRRHPDDGGTFGPVVTCPFPKAMQVHVERAPAGSAPPATFPCRDLASSSPGRTCRHLLAHPPPPRSEPRPSSFLDR